MAKLDNATGAAAQWASRLGASRQQYIDGINGVTTSPGQLAAAAGDRWLANTQAALPRFKANSAAVQLPAWKEAATGKGADRLASGATSAQPRMEQVFSKLFPAIKSVRASLPARGDINANVERSRQFALSMNKLKGSFK